MCDILTISSFSCPTLYIHYYYYLHSFHRNQFVEYYSELWHYIWCCIKLIVLNSIILNRIQQFIKVRDVSISGRREGIRYGNRKTFKDSNINNGYIKGVLLFHDLACWVCVREERAPFCLILVWFRPFIRIYRT